VFNVLVGRVGVGINIVSTVAGGIDLFNNRNNAGYGDVAKFGVDLAITGVTTALYLTGVGAPLALFLTGVQVANSLGFFDSIYSSFNFPLNTK